MTKLFCVLTLLLVVVGTALADGEDSKAQTVRDALAAGRPVILALASALPSPDAESETYADWAAYLNDFAAAHDGYLVLAMEQPEAAQLLAVPPPLDQRYATIFVRADAEAVIYDGPILEPFVYDAGAAFLDAPAGGRYDPELFEPYDLRLR